MIETLLAAIATLIVAIGGLLLITVIVFPYVAAKLDKFYTFRMEGKGTRVERGGKLERYVGFRSGHHLNNPFDPDQFVTALRELPDMALKAWDMVPDVGTLPGGTKYRWEDPRWFLSKYYNVEFIGIYPFVYVAWTPFTWKEWDIDAEGKKVIRTRKELTRFIFFKAFGYAGILPNAEFVGTGSVNIRYTIFLRTFNPRTAEYDNEDWNISVQTYVENQLRLYVKTRSYEELVAMKAKERPEDQEHIVEWMVELNKAIPGYMRTEIRPGEKEAIGLMELLGIEIVGIQIEDIELKESPEQVKLREATQKELIAEYEGKAALKAAQYRKLVTQTNASAEGRRIRMVYGTLRRYGNLATMIRHYEAMEASGDKGNTIVWAQNQMRQQGELGDALQKANVSPEELVAILSHLKKGKNETKTGGTK